MGRSLRYYDRGTWELRTVMSRQFDVRSRIGMVDGTYQFPDLTPMGREEPAAFPQFCVRRYEYGA